jgi:uncharacterized membrane protein (DUF485 family)
MNTQTIAGNIKHSKLYKHTVQFTWELCVLLLKLTFILGIIVLAFLAASFANSNLRDQDEDLQVLHYDEDGKANG